MTKSRPPIQLERWAVFKVKSRLKAVTGKVYVSGYCPTGDIGFVSGAVRAFDPPTATVTTTKGEFVKLVGEPGESRDGQLAWAKFCSMNRVVEDQDVSTRYIATKKRRAPANKPRAKTTITA